MSSAAAAGAPALATRAMERLVDDQDEPLKRLLSQKGGFDFSLCRRNENLGQAGVQLPKATSTGTTLAGCVFSGGVVLGADTRSTEGPIVADKNCNKIHFISKTIRCCGAGTAADTEQVTGMISSQLELHRLSTGREPRVVTAMTRLKRYLFQYQGYVSAALVLGGVDPTGCWLYTVWPHGSTDQLPYVSMGSGSLAAMSVLEDGYHDGMEEAECIKLVDEAIQSGIYNDMGSGSNVDLVIIRKDGTVEERRSHRHLQGRLFQQEFPAFPRGTTQVLAEVQENLRTLVDVVPMDVDTA